MLICARRAQQNTLNTISAQINIFQNNQTFVNLETFCRPHIFQNVNVEKRKVVLSCARRAQQKTLKTISNQIHSFQNNQTFLSIEIFCSPRFRNCMDLQFDLGNSGLYVISYGRGSGFCMDLQFDLGNSGLYDSVWNFLRKRICFLYGFAIGFGEFHIGPYGPKDLYGSVWNFLQKRIWFLY